MLAPFAHHPSPFIMSRPDCISNRNLTIIYRYVKSRLGHADTLFEGLEVPSGYASAEDFFLNEDQWTTYLNFSRVIRKASALVGEPDFFFNCGASSAKFQSWGRFHYFVRVFATPADGYKRLPFFNKNFNDTKEIEVIFPPVYHPRSKKIRTLLKISFHDDFDADVDFIGDAFMRGILSSIPTIWNLPLATVEQNLFPYNPEVVFNRDPEFENLKLDVKIENHELTLQDPKTGARITVGREVVLEPEMIEGVPLFLGKYRDLPKNYKPVKGGPWKAVLIIENFSVNGFEILKAGEIYKAPYCILKVSFERVSRTHRISQIMRVGKNDRDGGAELSETIDQLRKTIRQKKPEQSGTGRGPGSTERGQPSAGGPGYGADGGTGKGSK